MKKRFLLTTLAFMAYCGASLAANGDVLWKKNFGGSNNEWYTSVTTVPDGVIATGYADVGAFGSGDWTGVPIGGLDAFLVKYNSSGVMQWRYNTKFGGRDMYHSVTTVSDGVVAAGFMESTGFNTGDWAGIANKGNMDAIIVKYNNDGAIVWKKNFGGGIEEFFSVIVVSDGVLAVGYSDASSFGKGDWAGVAGKGKKDAIIVKFDNNGKVMWQKHFGGSGDDVFTSVTLLKDNGIVAVGYSDALSFGNGDWAGAGVKAKGTRDAIIVKYTVNGTLLWQKNKNYDTYAYEYTSVTTVSDGVIAVGKFCIDKYNNNGGKEWEKIFLQYITSVTAVSDGIITAGSVDSDDLPHSHWPGAVPRGHMDAAIVKFNDNGDVVWQKNLGGKDRDEFSCITAVPNGVVTVGYADAPSFGNGDWVGVSGKGNRDAIVVKYEDIEEKECTPTLYTNDIGYLADVSDWTLSGVTWNIANSGQLIFATAGSYAVMPILPTGATNMKITITARYGDYIYLHTSPDGNTYTNQGLFTGGNSIETALKNIPDGTHYIKFVANTGTINDVYLISVTVTGDCFTTTSVTDVTVNTQAKVTGYYNIVGQKLLQEPEGGIYIIRYDDGTTKKIIKK